MSRLADFAEDGLIIFVATVGVGTIAAGVICLFDPYADFWLWVILSLIAGVVFVFFAALYRIFIK